MSTATVTRNGHDEGAAGSPSTSRHSGLARRLVPIAAVGVLGAAAFFTTVGAIATLYNGCDQTQTIGWASYHSYTDFLRARATAGQDASVAQQVDFCLKWGIANNPFVDIATCNTVLQNPSLTFFGTKVCGRAPFACSVQRRCVRPAMSLRDAARSGSTTCTDTSTASTRGALP